MSEFVPLGSLEERGFGRIVCYPRFDSEEFGKRLSEMEGLGVETLSFTGNKTINNVQVLGKGYVGVVILAKTKVEIAAVKVRRTDSGREGMGHEAEVLAKANSVGVGPKLIGCSENILLMEYVDGSPFPKWIEGLKATKKSLFTAKNVLNEVLEQCWRLDEASVDHGELSNAQKHILVRDNGRVCILDFESASVGRRVSNVTSVCHYLFVRSSVAEVVREKVVDVDSALLLGALRRYKEDRTRSSFEAVLKIVF